MTRDDIMHLANQAAGQNWGSEDHLQRFAALVAKNEREACAQVAEWEPCITHTPQRIAAAIRARNTQ